MHFYNRKHTDTHTLCAILNNCFNGSISGEWQLSLARFGQLLKTALFCKSRWCQALGSSLKHAQCLNDGGLVSLTSRPQPVWNCFSASGHHDPFVSCLVANFAGLSNKNFLAFSRRRQTSICGKTRGTWPIAHSHPNWRASHC